ncbi:MAG: hypothetical protein JW873_02935 [Candidatus Saganbacteria bacterium]|nr:hypothetical protein [Candidatus Saganbacteria bacterium]
MPIQASHSYKRWVIGLGIASALSGYMICRSTKKVVPPPTTQPASEAIFKPAQRDALARLGERMRVGPIFDSGPKLDLKNTLTPEEIPPTPQPTNELSQLLSGLNDSQVAFTEISSRAKIKASTNGVCPDPSGASKSSVGNDYSIKHLEFELRDGDRSLGYIYLYAGDNPLEILKNQTYYGVFDPAGGHLGYMQTNFADADNSSLDFVSRSGERAGFFGTKNEVYRSDDPSEERTPIGDINEETGDITADGKVLGKIDKGSYFVFVESAPKCDRPETKGLFLKVGSREEMDGFFDKIRQSIPPDEWNSLMIKEETP